MFPANVKEAGVAPSIPPAPHMKAGASETEKPIVRKIGIDAGRSILKRIGWLQRGIKGSRPGGAWLACDAGNVVVKVLSVKRG